MSAYQISNGLPRTIPITLTDGSATTILTATRRFMVVGIVLVNHSGGALTPTVDLYRSSTQFILQDAESLADEASFKVELPGDFVHLQINDLIRVAAAANLTAWISYSDPHITTGARQ